MPGDDHLVLEGLVFYGHHGHLAAERKLGSEVRVDLRVRTSIGAAAKVDRLERALDYVQVHEVVRAIVERRRFVLLETLAEAIAAAVLKLPGAEGVWVRVGKHPPLAARFQTFAVEIERTRRRPARRPP